MSPLSYIATDDVISLVGDVMWRGSAGDVEDLRSRVSERVHGGAGLPRLRSTVTVYVSVVRRHRHWHQWQFANVPLRRRLPDWRYFRAGHLRRRTLWEQLHRRLRGTGEKSTYAINFHLTELLQFHPVVFAAVWGYVCSIVAEFQQH